MPESVTPLIAVGVVIVLFIVLLSVLTNTRSTASNPKLWATDSTEPRAGRPRRRSKNRMPVCRLMLLHGAQERICRRCRD